MTEHRPPSGHGAHEAPTVVPTDAESVGVARAQAEAALTAADTLEALALAKTSQLGEWAPLSVAHRAIKNLPASEKATAGRLVGHVRKHLESLYAERAQVLQERATEKALADEAVDVTACPRRWRPAALHPLTVLQERMSDIFLSMGWSMVEGPEVESEWFNFDALNFEPDHPARELQDTFFIDPPETRLLMRTHTSPVQVRALLERSLPAYIFCPGKVFRTDEFDATHTPVFHQIEGLAVDRHLTMAHLRGTLQYFTERLFGPQIRVRLRPNYFPFTEPSAELDIWYPRALGGSQWIEWGGCGMVHPHVLRAAGIDPDEYTGFAFGMGVERALMFRNAVTDMRDMVEGDIRFNEQLGRSC